MNYASFLERCHARPLSVTYYCNEECKRGRPVNELFFCQDCSRLVCDQCCGVEIDTYFCPSCLNSVLSSAAFTDSNRCQKCADCPVCLQTLSTAQSGETFYYWCEFCQWNSKGLNLTGKKVQELYAALKQIDDSSQQPDAPFFEIAHRYRELYKEMKKAAQPETVVPKRRHDLNTEEAIQNLEKALTRKNRLMYRIPPEVFQNEHVKVAPDSMHERNFDPTSVASLEQRLANPSVTSTATSQLIPRRKHLLTKNAYRCKKCTKYVVKPKVGAAHVAFDKRTLGVSSIPSITISEIPAKTFKVGEPSQIILYFRNPSHVDVSFTLSETVIPEPLGFDPELDQREASTGSVFLPNIEVIIPAYDEVADQDENLVEDARKQLLKEDDPKIVAMRKLSKVGVFITVTPRTDKKNIKFAIRVDLSSKVKLDFEKFSFVAVIDLGPADAH